MYSASIPIIGLHHGASRNDRSDSSESRHLRRPDGAKTAIERKRLSAGVSPKEATVSSALLPPAVYDGATHVGYIRAHDDRRFSAFDSAGHSLGTFLNQREAVRAIPARGEA